METSESPTLCGWCCRGRQRRQSRECVIKRATIQHNFSLLNEHCNTIEDRKEHVAKTTNGPHPMAQDGSYDTLERMKTPRLGKDNVGN